MPDNPKETNSPEGGLVPGPVPDRGSAVQIPDHELIRCIGSGSYGDVWLARNVMGSFRAIKIIHRRTFRDDRPYEREYEGIKSFDPISRTHPGLICVLHMGRNQAGGYFYYVMEVADDVRSGQNIDPAKYVPKTLQSQLSGAGTLPFEGALQIALALTAALGHLHKHGLVHRDIKPSNILITRGEPKFADIGLVTKISDSGTFLGTEGYVAPEGPGKPLADIYSLGKLLYEVSTGNSLRHFSEQLMPEEQESDPQLKQLSAIAVKACQLNPGKRWQSTEEMHAELLRLRGGEHVSSAQGTVVSVGPVVGLSAAGVGQSILNLGMKLTDVALESIGGAIPLNSAFYIVRPADQQFEGAIGKRDSIVLVKGARQMGKTSLLARALQVARGNSFKVILTDYQKLNSVAFESLEKFYLALGESLAVTLDLETFPAEDWDSRRSANTNFERYLRREVLDKLDTHLIWGMDEVDRLFPCTFSGEVFALFRSWHNARATDPSGPWSKLTLAIAYATEAHLFISDAHMSPFNVGTRLRLDDFSPEQVRELNRRYGSPLQSHEVGRLVALLGGQPFLIRRGLHELATQILSMDAFEKQCGADEGIFGDHLRRLLVALAKDPALVEVVRQILKGQGCSSLPAFYRLRSAGLMVGEGTATVRPRCELYTRYLKQHLL